LPIGVLRSAPGTKALFTWVDEVNGQKLRIHC
jgi:hypothetical protein